MKYWLTFNEIDSIHRHYSLQQELSLIVAQKVKVEETVYQALHHQFVASALVTADCHRIIPGSQVGCMTKLTTYPHTCHPNDIGQALKQNLEKLFLCRCSGVWRISTTDTARMLERKNIHIQMEADDLNILKENTVDFISFSYYMSLTESAQEGLEQTEGNTIRGVKNPYLPSTDWELAN
ncbi:family 1 glycosylhydrolase [Bacillus sp. SL00103]